MSTGKVFENRIKRWHKKIECLTFKFPDLSSCGSTQKALCDRVTVTSNGVYWLECKHTNNKVSFNKSLIKPHQMDVMLRLEKLTNKAYFVLEDGNKNVYFVKPMVLNGNFKSIKFSRLTQNIAKNIETFIK